MSKKHISWWNLSLNEKSFHSLSTAYKKKFLSNGPLSLSFQKELENFLNCRHTHLTTSGSTSLLLALKVLGIVEGDEVIVPNRTFQATAHAPFFLGAKVKCAEVDPERGLIIAETIRPLITKKTKAIIVVHLNGRAVDLDPILKLAAKNKIAVIEDAAQAFGSTYKGRKLGSIGDIGCFSFGVTKFMTMGQGGAIVTNRSDLNEKIQHYLFQGQSGIDDKRFDVPGFNFRMSNLLVAIGIPQFKKFTQNKNKFIKIHNLYSKWLSKTPQVKFIPARLPDEIPIWAEVLVENRNGLYDFLKSKNIETVKFYPSIYQADYLQTKQMRFPHSAIFEENGLILPCGLDLSVENQKRVIEAIKSFYEGK